MIDLLAASGVSMTGKRVADIGCGDGIIDLGIAVKGEPATLFGFDLNPVDTDKLLAEATQEAGIKKLPESLDFIVSAPERIPAEDNSFDNQDRRVERRVQQRALQTLGRQFVGARNRHGDDRRITR